MPFQLCKGWPVTILRPKVGQGWGKGERPVRDYNYSSAAQKQQYKYPCILPKYKVHTIHKVVVKNLWFERKGEMRKRHLICKEIFHEFEKIWANNLFTGVYYCRFGITLLGKTKQTLTFYNYFSFYIYTKCKITRFYCVILRFLMLSGSIIH